MQITNENDAEVEYVGDSPYAQLLNLQTAYQSRLLDESLRYLTQVHNVLVPRSPGTILVPRPDLSLATSANPGESATLSFELSNVQRVHCMVMPHLTPLVLPDGTTWFPVSEPSSRARLLAPDETTTIDVTVDVPEKAPPGTYSGALLLIGFRAGAIPVHVEVADADRKATPTPKAAARKQPKRRAAAKASAAKRAAATARSKPAPARRGTRAARKSRA